MRELEPPIDRDTTERDAISEIDSADVAAERDSASVMDPAEEVVESSSTPVPVSGTPPTPRDGLPDYVALITAEIEAIEAGRAAAARISEAVSPGTPRPSGAVASQKRYPGASSLGVRGTPSYRPRAHWAHAVAARSRASTSQSAISAMETGNRLPSVRTLMRIAEAAGFELVVGLREPGAAAPDRARRPDRGSGGRPGRLRTDPNAFGAGSPAGGTTDLAAVEVECHPDAIACPDDAHADVTEPAAQDVGAVGALRMNRISMRFRVPAMPTFSPQVDGL